MNTEIILNQTTRLRDDLLKDLADTEFAMYYFKAALADYEADGNAASLWMALRDVVEAQGGIGRLAQQTKANPQHFNAIFAAKQKPRLDNLQSTLYGLLKCGQSLFHGRCVSKAGLFFR